MTIPCAGFAGGSGGTGGGAGGLVGARPKMGVSVQSASEPQMPSSSPEPVLTLPSAHEGSAS